MNQLTIQPAFSFFSFFIFSLYIFSVYLHVTLYTNTNCMSKPCNAVIPISLYGYRYKYLDKYGHDPKNSRK